MVQVGTIEYRAKVVGAEEAQSKTDDLRDSYAEMGEQAETTAGASAFLGGTLSTTADETQIAGEEAAEADTQFTLLLGTLGGVARRLAGLTFGGLAGGGGLGSMLSGVGLGSLITKAPSIATLLKGGAALGALVIAADTIGDIIDGEDPITAFVTSAEDFGEFVLNPIGIENGLVEGVAGIGTFILGTMSIASFITGVPISAMIMSSGATIAGYFGYASISSLIVGGGTTLAAYLGFASLGALVTTVGSIAALIGGIASLGDLIDGDISSWNLPGKFGYALGEGFARAWPDMAEKIRNAFKNNPIHGAGEFTGNVLRGEGEGAVEGENRELSTNLETGFIDPRETPGLSQAYDAGEAVDELFEGFGFPGAESGGMIETPGIAEVHKGEAVIPEPLVNAAKGGGVGVPDVDVPERGGGSPTVTNVDNVTIELTGEFDPSNVTRRELNSLADRLVDRIGDKTNRRAGVR